MNKKTSISIIVILIGVLSLVWWSNSTTNTELSANDSTKSHPARTGEVLIAKEVFYDFGTISMENGNVSKIFQVVNSGSKDIGLPSLTTSCMCTKAYFIEPNGNKKGPFGMPGMGFVPKLNAVIKAGQSANIEVVYDPNAHGPAGVGVIDRFVYLTDASENTLQFEIKAVVTP
ncbi:MAG: DUF1573 domain-containing protein [bacterium]|nr:DUF1573 domain-containing protein [bacterium]